MVKAARLIIQSDHPTEWSVLRRTVFSGNGHFDNLCGNLTFVQKNSLTSEDGFSAQVVRVTVEQSDFIKVFQH